MKINRNGFLIKTSDNYSLGYLTDSSDTQDHFTDKEIKQMKDDNSLRAFDLDNAVITPYHEALKRLNDNEY